MKIREYFDLWKKGFFLTLKIYALAYIVQFIVVFSLGIFAAATASFLPEYVLWAIIIILAVVLIPPFIAIAGEHLRLTREPKNKTGHDFTK